MMTDISDLARRAQEYLAQRMNAHRIHANAASLNADHSELAWIETVAWIVNQVRVQEIEK